MRLRRESLRARDPSEGVPRRGGAVDVPRIGEPKTKMLDAARLPEVLRSLLEHEAVVPSGSLGLKEVLVPIHGHHTEQVVIKLKGSLKKHAASSKRGIAESSSRLE